MGTLLGLESQEQYLTRRLGAHHEAMRYVNEQCPPDAQPIYLWEPRSYYDQHQVWLDATLDNLTQLRLTYADAQAAVSALKADGFTHLLLY
jgi:hypothetical protein